MVLYSLIILLGLTLITYSLLDLLGVNVLYIIKYLLSSEVRLRRSRVKGFIKEVLPQRLNLVYYVLLGIKAPSNLPLPSVELMLRESGRPGGRYVWGLGLILLDVPKRVEDVIPVLDHELTHYVQDLEGIGGPKWCLEGMAAWVELKLHGKIRGYRKELLRYLELINRDHSTT